MQTKKITEAWNQNYRRFGTVGIGSALDIFQRSLQAGKIKLRVIIVARVRPQLVPIGSRNQILSDVIGSQVGSQNRFNVVPLAFSGVGVEMSFIHDRKVSCIIGTIAVGSVLLPP